MGSLIEFVRELIDDGEFVFKQLFDARKRDKYY